MENQHQGDACAGTGRILKGALERGAGLTSSLYNNFIKQEITMPIGCFLPSSLLQRSNPHSPIPYSTMELRRILLEKYGRLREEDVGNEDLVREAFADFVVNVPIWVDGLPIKRKAWAKAFYEIDMISSAKCLFEALFSEEEMRKCTLNGKSNTEELCAMKMLAILRASCWMKNKEQDPYCFSPAISEHNVQATKEEQDKIEKKVFTERRSQANRKNKKRKMVTGQVYGAEEKNGWNINIGNLVIVDPESDSQNMHDSDNNNYFENSGSSGSLSPPMLSPGLSLTAEINEYGNIEELFYRYSEEFVTVLLPTWMEKFIYIDGILVKKDKWRKAFEEAGDSTKAAWTLFQAMFSEEEITSCTLNGKNRTRELCPLKKLAIIRAVEWMRLQQGDRSKIEYWDNDDDCCNVFPSKEDKERIETKVFTEKRYQQSRLLNMKQTRSEL